MKKILTGALAALTIGGAMAATTVPAAAQSRDGYHNGGGGYHGGYDRGGGYHNGGYRGGYYGGGYRGGDATAAALIGLMAGAALTGGAYAPNYYAAPRCRIEMRWNPNWGGYDRVRVCY